MNKANLIVGLILILFIISSEWLLLRSPPIWPDEVLYADVVQNYKIDSQLKTGLLGDMLPGAKDHVYWNPPLFFYILIGWFKVLPVSIYYQRQLSLSVAIGFLLILFSLCKRLFLLNADKIYILTLSGLVVDQVFMNGSHVSRPEIFVLLVSTLASYLTLTPGNKFFWQKRSHTLFLGGLVFGLVILIHLIGIVFGLAFILSWLVSQRFEVFKERKFYIFCIAFCLPLFVWGFTLLQHQSAAVAQLFLATSHKSLETPWIRLVFTTQDENLKLIFALYLILSCFFVYYSIKQCKLHNILLTSLLLVLWSAQIIGKMFWYFILLVPFIYLAASTMLLYLSQKTLLYKIVLVSFVLLVGLNFYQAYSQYPSFLESQDPITAYADFTKQISSLIPEQKTIFISAIPDPYYGLKFGAKLFHLYEFPALYTPTEKYLQVLNDSDYIIYNGTYNNIIFGNLLENYIKQNTKTMQVVNATNPYTAEVIELKSRNQRQFVE